MAFDASRDVGSRRYFSSINTTEQLYDVDNRPLPLLRHAPAEPNLISGDTFEERQRALGVSDQSHMSDEDATDSAKNRTDVGGHAAHENIMGKPLEADNSVGELEHHDAVPSVGSYLASGGGSSQQRLGGMDGKLGKQLQSGAGVGQGHDEHAYAHNGAATGR